MNGARVSTQALSYTAKDVRQEKEEMDRVLNDVESGKCIIIRVNKNKLFLFILRLLNAIVSSSD